MLFKIICFLMMCVIMPLIMLFKIICFLKIVINAVETSVHIAGEQILVFEFVGNGSLFDRLHTFKGKAHPLPWTTRMQIALDVARAIEYLHKMASPRVIHRDIKSPNILLTEEDAGRLADFGLSKLGQQQEQWTPPKGSHGYIDE